MGIELPAGQQGQLDGDTVDGGRRRPGMGSSSQHQIAGENPKRSQSHQLGIDRAQAFGFSRKEAQAFRGRNAARKVEAEKAGRQAARPGGGREGTAGRLASRGFAGFGAQRFSETPHELRKA